MSADSIDEAVLNDVEKGTRFQDDATPAGPLGVCDTATLAFFDIRYRVPNAKGGKKEILQGISGFCKGGRLLALMGASGMHVPFHNRHRAAMRFHRKSISASNSQHGVRSIHMCKGPRQRVYRDLGEPGRSLDF